MTKIEGLKPRAAARKKGKQQRILRPFKCTDAELALMQKNADKYTRGNLSHWIRLAAIRHEPSKRLSQGFAAKRGYRKKDVDEFGIPI